MPNGRTPGQPDRSTGSDAADDSGASAAATAAAAAEDWLAPDKGVNCDDAVHQLYHYLDGELTEERRQQIADHLDLCRPCAGAMEFEADLRRVIASRCRDHVPDALLERIATAIDEERRRHGEPV